MTSSTTSDDPIEPAPQPRRSGKLAVGLFALVAIAAVVYFAVAMPGMDMSTDTRPSGSSPGTSGMDMAKASSQLLSPAEFARAKAAGAFVVNVHTPYAGEIAGTDAFVPFDGIASDPHVPRDRDARIVLYCRSGRMSAIASRALLDAGYMRVSELGGGMDAWTACGRDLTERAA